jgi:hypothetical protein
MLIKLELSFFKWLHLLNIASSKMDILIYHDKMDEQEFSKFKY